MKYLVYFGLFVFAYILSTLDLDLVLNQIGSIKIIYLFFAFLLNIPMIFLKSYRWQKILQKQNLNIPILKSFEYYFASLYLGFITPGRIGEISRVLYIKKIYKSNDYGSIFSSVIIDRLFDLYFLLIVTIIGFIYLSLEISTVYIIFFLLSFIIIPFLIMKTNIFLIVIEKVASKLSSSFKEKTLLFMDNFKNSFISVFSVKNISLFSLLTLLSYSIFFIQAYLITLSLNININFITLSLIISILLNFKKKKTK